MRALFHLLGPVLLAVHVGLMAWALAGLAEWLLPSVAWQRVSNRSDQPLDSSPTDTRMKATQRGFNR